MTQAIRLYRAIVSKGFRAVEIFEANRLTTLLSMLEHLEPGTFDSIEISELD